MGDAQNPKHGTPTETACWRLRWERSQSSLAPPPHWGATAPPGPPPKIASGERRRRFLEGSGGAVAHPR
eukprot:7973798-Alexandrium_andersonii.AAC.1